MLARTTGFLRRLMASKFRVSYAQMGEDIVVHKLLNAVPRSYVDIGSNHPVYGNNSYYFYLRGARGICIDPNGSFISSYAKIRPGDDFIPAAVTSSMRERVRFVRSGGATDWYVSLDENRTLSACEEVPNMHVNTILARLCTENIDLVSIDIEPMTAELVEAIDFDRFKIAALCVEADKSPGDRRRISGVLEENGYVLSASNPINLIYTRKGGSACPPSGSA